MKYTGRITALSATFVVFLIIRIVAYYQYNYTAPPILAVICFFVAWWLGKQYDRAKFYSEKDALTGLYNRRFVDNVLPIFLAQMDRSKERLSLAILDCDNFKVINDTLGHKRGDEMLKEFSTALLRTVRKSDVVARWGGDEFLVIAPYAEKQDIEVVISRFKEELQKLSQSLKIELSISVGYAVFPDEANNIDELISNADSAMYAQKNQIKIPD